MVARTRFSIGVSAFAVLFLSQANMRGDETPRGASWKPWKWPRVLVSDPWTANVTRQALDTASERLKRPSCAAVFGDFTDRNGEPLTQCVSRRGFTAETYLSAVLFVDAPGRSCPDGILARAEPGSLVVRLCNEAVRKGWRQDLRYTTASIIHEVLHTAGLGENPPPSASITRQVLARCGKD
jgi:hypothetical protein